MRVCFYHSDKPRERILADAVLEGARVHGDEGYKVPAGQPIGDCDIACMVGVKSREAIQWCWNRGIHTVYFDKGYLRRSLKGPVKTWQYWRVAVDAHHPTEYVAQAKHPGDRFEHFELEIKPWREGKNVVIAGSSQKYHDFYGLYDPTRFAHKQAKAIAKLTMRPIVYRPKPTWKEATPIEGTTFSGSDQKIQAVLRKAHVLVTHGSNACFEAVLEGVPCIVLGNAVARPISSTEVEDVEHPYKASDEERYQWFSNLAYCQWKLDEFASGQAWSHIRPQVFY